MENDSKQKYKHENADIPIDGKAIERLSRFYAKIKHSSSNDNTFFEFG